MAKITPASGVLKEAAIAAADPHAGAPVLVPGHPVELGLSGLGLRELFRRLARTPRQQPGQRLRPRAATDPGLRWRERGLADRPDLRARPGDLRLATPGAVDEAAAA